MYDRRNGDRKIRKPLRICECSCYCVGGITVKKVDLCTACQFNRHKDQDGRTYKRPKTP